jgi:hypothetical protein
MQCQVEVKGGKLIDTGFYNIYLKYNNINIQSELTILDLKREVFKIEQPFYNDFKWKVYDNEFQYPLPDDYILKQNHKYSILYDGINYVNLLMMNKK